jgi:hypothetical protein
VLPHNACSVCGRWTNVQVCEVCQLKQLVEEARPLVEYMMAAALSGDLVVQGQEWIDRSEKVVPRR